MASKAVKHESNESSEAAETPFGELYLMAIPVPTYKKISDEAAKRGQTFTQAVSRAFDLYAGDQKESQESQGPRLLTEDPNGVRR